MQDVTYYIEGLFRQANAKYARDYLGIIEGAGNGTVTNALDLAENVVVVGDDGTVGVKTIASIGVANQVLKSNGPGLPPSFQDEAGGGGNVTTGITLTLNAVVLGNGTQDLKVVGSLGSSNQVLTSNGPGSPPSWQDVGGGDVTHSVPLTENAVVLGNGAADLKVVGSLGSAAQVLTSNGAGVPPSWQAAPSGGGNVTTAVTLDNHGVIVGSGVSAVDVKDIAVGTTNTVLHGNTGADPSFSKVVEDDITLADVTTHNSAAGQHGFLKKLNSNPLTFMDGSGNWSVPSGQSGLADNFEYRESLFSYASGQTNPVVVGTAASEGGSKLAQTPSEFQLPYTRYRTGAISGNRAFAMDGNTGARMSWTIRTMWCITAANDPDARYWVCMTAGSDTTLGNDTPSVVQIGFRYNPNFGDPNWMAVFNNGSSTEEFDTTFAVDTTVMPRFELQWDGTNPIKWFINGSQVAESTLAMAPATTFFRQLAGVETLAGAAKDIHIGLLKWRGKITY